MYLQVHVMVAYLSNFTWLWLRCSFRRLCHHQTPFTFEGVAPSGPPLWSFSLALGMPWLNGLVQRIVALDGAHSRHASTWLWLRCSLLMP